MPPRFRRLRQSRLIRALKWLFIRPFFWAAIAIIIVLNWGYGQLVPHIRHSRRHGRCVAIA
jgi:hypothetical protein